MRVVINPGTDREVWGTLFMADTESVTLLCHGGSLRKFSRKGNVIKFIGQEDFA